MDSDELYVVRCTGCRRVPPSCRTSHTLIGAHGWRLNRLKTAEGVYRIQHWCPACWAALREKHIEEQLALRGR